MNRIPIKGELVTFQDTDGYHHDGILYEAYNSSKTIIHVHGSYGNFYQANFIKTMAMVYTKAGYNFLSFNLRTHDGFGEGYRNENDFEYIGGALSDWVTCVSDISGAIEFVNHFSSSVILQGHSLGCDRVVFYLLSSEKKYDFILLAPCDSHQLHSNWLHPHSVEDQIKRISRRDDSFKDFDWLPTNEYGITSINEEYILPITRRALLSIITGPPFKLFNISNPPDYYLNQNCFIYIGGRDNLQTESPQRMFDFFKRHISAIETCYIKEGDHMLTGHEKTVAEKINNWLFVRN